MITRKANTAGALCGIIGSIFIQLIVIQQQSVHLLLYTTTGFVSCFVIGYIASWIIPGKTKNIDHLTIYKIFSKNKNMKNYQRLKGLIAASFTPMDAQGKINLSVIDKYADLMAKSDMTGVFVCGTTGESQSLTTNERKIF